MFEDLIFYSMTATTNFWTLGSYKKENKILQYENSSYSLYYILAILNITIKPLFKQKRL